MQHREAGWVRTNENGWVRIETHRPTESLLRALILLPVVIMALLVLTSLSKYVSSQERQGQTSESLTLVEAVNKATAEIPIAFKEWRTSTANGNEVLDWNGSTASILWTQSQMYPYQHTAQFVVWAVTPSKRYFTVVFELREDQKLKLAPEGAFREWKVDDVVRVLNENGQWDLIKKLDLVRGPA